MTRELKLETLTTDAFAPFGTMMDIAASELRMINGGTTERFHGLAMADTETGGGRTILSLFRGQPRVFPYAVDMMERHPLGSQAFVPMSLDPFLVIVAPDEAGKPGRPRAFLTAPGQGINFHRGTWHGVLTPLAEPGLFAVIDRIGEGSNLEEHRFETPYRVLAG